MSTDEKDNGSPKDKKSPPPPRQVVVTHYGKKKKPPEDVPPEILPRESTHIVSSPVDIGSSSQQSKQPTSSATSAEAIKPPFEQQGIKEPSPRIPEAIFPKAASGEAEPKLSYVASPTSASAEGAKQSIGDEAPGGVPPRGTVNEGKPSSGGGSFLFNLITLSALIALGFYAYSTHQQVNELEQKAQDDFASMQMLTDQAKKSFAQVDEIRNRQSAEIKTLQNFRGEIESAQSRLVNLSGNSDWVLAQANYLAFMANERLKTAHDITTALAQLNAADEQLKNLGNPAFMKVREALAKDIAKLHAFPAVNRQALWEQLSLLSIEFNQLHYKRITSTSADKTTTTEDTTSWRQGLARSWQELKSLIRVTRLEENAIPLALSEEEQSQILRTLQLICEQAQWAVLQGDTKIYARSLQSLQAWIQRYFADDAVKQHVLDEIKQLEQQQIEMTFPDISGSLNALSQAMIEVTQKAPTPPAPPKGVSQ